MKHAIERAAASLQNAEAVLLTAGAGLSAAAGFDYTDPVRFKELFPAFAAKGFSARYQAIGYQGWTAAEHWGYWATHVADIRFDPRPNPLYQQLSQLVAGHDTFVMTSNVDWLFARNGFDDTHVFSPQGDYGFLQCKRACRQEVWDSAPIVRDLLEVIDPRTQTITDLTRIPHCPWCGGEVFFNVRLDQFFVETPYVDQLQRLRQWLSVQAGKALVILEIGAGFNTPGVIRWPDEQLARSNPAATLIRINRDAAEVPAELGPRGIALPVDADAAIQSLLVVDRD